MVYFEEVIGCWGVVGSLGFWIFFFVELRCLGCVGGLVLVLWEFFVLGGLFWELDIVECLGMFGRVFVVFLFVILIVLFVFCGLYLFRLGVFVDLIVLLKIFFFVIEVDVVVFGGCG